MERWSVAAIFSIACVAVNLAQGVTPGALHGFSGYEFGRSVPFEVQSGFLIVVPGSVGERSGLRFILDTGTTRSFLDERIAGIVAPNLGKSKASELFNFERTLNFEERVVDDIQVGPLRFDRAKVEVARIAGYSDLAEGTDGIMGLDLLRSSGKVLLDYEAKRVWFPREREAANAPSSPQAFKVTIDVQGAKIRLIVDTGFYGIAVYKDRLLKQVEHLRIEGEPTPVELGAIHATRVRLPDVSIAGAPETAEISLLKADPKDELQVADGFIGLAAWHARRVEFDFEEERLRWQ